MSPDAARAMQRALRRRGGPGAIVKQARAVDWGSLLYEGQRHAVTLALPKHAASGFVSGIGEAGFRLAGHIVADIIVVARDEVDDMAMVEVEALTVMAA